MDVHEILYLSICECLEKIKTCRLIVGYEEIVVNTFLGDCYILFFVRCAVCPNAHCQPFLVQFPSRTKNNNRCIFHEKYIRQSFRMSRHTEQSTHPCPFDCRVLLAIVDGRRRMEHMSSF